jgi:hypothetical protein
VSQAVTARQTPAAGGIQTGSLKAGAVTRLCLITTAVSVCVLWPLDYAWWSLMGWIG